MPKILYKFPTRERPESIYFYNDMSLVDIVAEINGITHIEKWKDVVGFEGLYRVSDLGRIKRLYHIRDYPNSGEKRTLSERIQKQTTNPYGYLYLEMKRKKIFSHIIVAMAWIENPENKPEVNHKWGVKKDNRVSELEWSTRSENRIHAYRLGLSTPNKTMLGKKWSDNPFSISINQLTKDGECIKTWSSQSEAAETLNIRQGNIWSALNGKYKTTGGYKWEYSKM